MSLLGMEILRTFIMNDEEYTLIRKVYEFKEAYCRMRYPGENWEELMKTEIERYGQQVQEPPSDGARANPVRVFQLVCNPYCVIVNQINNQSASQMRC